MSRVQALGAQSRPTLSIIIVTFNGWALTKRCLRSLESQQGEIDSEVIVVDNSSSEGTPMRIREAFAWVTVLACSENVGFAAANNIGLAQARGEFLLLLNPDTELPPLALRDVLEAIRREPDIGMLGCKLVKPDGSLDHACKRGFPSPAGALLYFTRLERMPLVGLRLSAAGRYRSADLDADHPGNVDAINGAFMLVRRTAADAVGPLDETFWMYGEDLDWCYRFWQSGWRVYYWPGVAVLHHKGGSSGRHRRWSTNYAFHRSMWVYFRKHELANRGRIVGITVWLGIWLRLLCSAACNLVRCHLPLRSAGSRT